MEIKKINHKSTSWIGLDEEHLVRQYFERRYLRIPTRLEIEEIAQNLTSFLEASLKVSGRTYGS